MHDFLDDPATQRFAARRATGWRQQDGAVVLAVEGIREPDATGIAAILAGARLNDAVEQAELAIAVLESGAVRLRLGPVGAALGADETGNSDAALLDPEELTLAPLAVTTGDGTLRLASERHGGYGPDPEDITIEIVLDPFELTVVDAGGRALIRLASEPPAESDHAGVAPFAWVRRPVRDGIAHWTTISLALEPDERLFGLGQAEGPLNLVGATHLVPAVSPSISPTSRPPFLLSSRGPGLLLHTTSRVSADVGYRSPTALTLAVESPALDVIMFPSTWPRTALSAYARLTGREEAPPASAFAATRSDLRAPTDPAAMRAHLRAALRFALTTPGFWSAPVAPDLGHAESPALFARWAQLALLSPLVGPPRSSSGSNPSGEPTVAAYLDLRRRLLPYLLHCARESAQNGLPMLRPMLLEFSWDPDAVELDDQYLLGRDLLVAPIFSDSTEPVTRRVYLPAYANWYDWWTGILYEGRQWVETTASLDRVPLYARAGTVIPLTDPNVRSGESAPPVTRLLLFAPRDGAIGASVEYGDDDLLGVEQERGERKARIYVEGIPNTLRDLQIVGLPASAHLVDASVPSIALTTADDTLPGAGGTWNGLAVRLGTGEFTAGLELGW